MVFNDIEVDRFLISLLLFLFPLYLYGNTVDRFLFEICKEFEQIKFVELVITIINLEKF